MLALTAVGVPSTVALSADAAPGPGVPGDPEFVPSAAQITDEVTELRTQRSRTYETTDGRRQTRVFAGSVNFRSGGEWRAIDNRLERSADGDLTNRANRYDVDLPKQLDEGAVTVKHGAASFGFALRGADDTAARADGESATYHDALPDVDVRYDALSDAVKETLTLKSADAPRTYRFDLDLSGGLAAKLTDAGELAVLGTDGQAKFVVPAPVAWQDGDENAPTGDPVSFTYDQRENVLTLEVDDRWLTAPERRFPVSIDPWVALPSDGRDCTLSSKPTEQAVSFCLGNIQVGKVSGYNQNALIDFNVADQIPDWVTVREAYAAFWLKSASGTAAQQITAHALTRSFVDGQASWANAQTGAPWTTPGGDVNPAPASVKSFSGSAANAWTYWSMSDQAQRWADGTDPDHGLLLRATSNPATWGGNFAASSDSVASHQPYFVVDHEPTYGEDGPFSFVYENLPGIQSGVNVATGRLTVRDTDHSVTEFALERFYNSADARTGSPLTEGWKLGAAPKASTNGNLDLIVEMPSGTVLRFPWDESSQTYAPDRYGNATASATSTHWIVDRTNGGGRFFFTKSNGRLTARQGAGQTEQVTYAYNTAGRLTTITAPGNKVTTLTYNTNGTLNAANLPDGQAVTYGYTNGRLAHRTKGADTTGYTYTSGRLTQIWSPDGKVVLRYDSAGRVDQVTRVTDLSTNTGPTTGFVYYDKTSLGPCAAGSAGRTVQTLPTGDTIMYCYDASLKVTQKFSTTMQVAAEGELADLADWFDSGDGLLGVYGVAEDLDGVRRTDLLVDGAVGASVSSSCTPTCPASARHSLIVDGRLLTEGRHILQVVGVDAGNREARTGAWPVSIDRSRPDAPSGVRADFDASRESTQLGWQASDPALPDSSPGSGVDSYEWRVVQTDGTWSQWRTQDRDEPAFLSRVAGDSVHLQVRSIDAVGNESVVTDATIDVGVGPPPVQYDAYDTCPEISGADQYFSCFNWAPASSIGARGVPLPAKGICADFAENPRSVFQAIEDDAKTKWHYNGKRILGRTVGPTTFDPRGYHDVFDAHREDARMSMRDSSPPKVDVRLGWNQLCGRPMRSRMTVKVMRYDTGRIRPRIAAERSFPSGTLVEADSQSTLLELHGNKYVFYFFWKYDTGFYGVRRGATVRSFGVDCSQVTDKCRFSPLEPGSPLN